MFKNFVTSRYGTGLIAIAAIAAVLAVAPAHAEVTAITAPGESVASPGPYTPEDSAALLGVLEAPGRSPSADVTFGVVQKFGLDSASVPDGPQSLDKFAPEPESKRFEAWDLKGGTIVPEPVTALLMGAGLAALAVFRGLRGRTGTE